MSIKSNLVRTNEFYIFIIEISQPIMIFLFYIYKNKLLNFKVYDAYFSTEIIKLPFLVSPTIPRYRYFPTPRILKISPSRSK